MLDRCSWPALGAPYDAALQEAVAFILARYDLIGLIASGSIVRVQRGFHGVAVEIFVNPPVSIREYSPMKERPRDCSRRTCSPRVASCSRELSAQLQ